MPNYNYNPAAIPQATPMPQQIPQNVQPLFPQPQGNVYSINSTLEMANVPVGAGISVALCLPENVMYIKAMQNGNPLLYPYKLMPYNQMTAPQEEIKEEAKPDQYAERIAELEAKVEKLLKKKGDDWAV